MCFKTKEAIKDVLDMTIKDLKEQRKTLDCLDKIMSMNFEEYKIYCDLYGIDTKDITKDNFESSKVETVRQETSKLANEILKNLKTIL